MGKKMIRIATAFSDELAAPEFALEYSGIAHKGEQMKAIEILEDIMSGDTNLSKYENMAYEQVEAYFYEAIAEIKAMEEHIKELEEIMQQYLIPLRNYEAELRAKDEHIKELEELMKPKTCKTCKYWDSTSYGIWKQCFNGRGNCASTQADFGCNKYESKEQ